jgi:Sulfotransferase family
MAVNPYVFIVGCPRSGTTLLQRIVDAYPASVVFETHWIPRWFEKRRGLTPEGLVTPGSRTSCSKTLGWRIWKSTTKNSGGWSLPTSPFLIRVSLPPPLICTGSARAKG